METTELDADDDFIYDFSTEDIKEFDELRKKRLKGESKFYTPQEAMAMITKNNSDNAR